MFEIFIRRPILSGVISVVIVFLGLLAITSLPITQFPDIVPPSVTVTARYTGANADVMAKTVATPLERAINGVPGMTYMTTVCTNDGMSLTTIYFKVGTDPDVASVNVQNRVTTVLDELPEEVIRAGVITEKEVNSMLMYLNIMSTDSSHTEKFVYNFADINILRELKRIDGVGFVEIMGSRDYAMRVWLNPNRLAAYNMSPQETAAIRSQNIEAAPGKTGISSDKIPQQLQYVLQYSGKFSTPEEYGEIVLKALPDGSVLRLKDVATIEFDSEDYNMISMTDGKPSASIMIKQRPGSNAREVIQNIKAKMEEIKESSFAPGMDYNISYDVSRFLDASISVVLRTLLEAFLLVFIVVYLFLQDFRSTLIPAIAVPVSLVGTFFFMQMLGFSINMLTLFALVLAIGIVVDNAIVVVEAVHVKMHNEKLPPAKATEAAIREIGGAIIAITLVMSAVFVPVGFMSGTVGIFYRQFSLTLAVAIVISGVNALTLSPALCALMLKPVSHNKKVKKNLLARFFDGFNKRYDHLERRYKINLRLFLNRRFLTYASLIIFCLATWGMTFVLPSGFIPNEDQGMIYVNVDAPPGATLERSEAALSKVQAALLPLEEVETVSTLAGYSLMTETEGASFGMGMINLKPWNEREQTAEELMRVYADRVSHIKDADIQFFLPPTVPGFGNASGFELRLQDKTAGTFAELDEVAKSFVAKLNADPRLSGVTSGFNPNFPQYLLRVDLAKAAKLGIDVNESMETLQSYVGSFYSSNFVRFGQMYKVMLQAAPEYRMNPEDLFGLYAKNKEGNMVPYSNFMTMERVYGPSQITRYNLFTSAMITGEQAPGVSSGEALEAVEEIAAEVLPRGYDIEWSGVAREEKESGGQSLVIFAICLVFVYLLLAAQYESLLLPLPVILSLPAGVFGSFLLLYAVGLENNIYAQVALVMLIGLLGKNAILIIEVANQCRKEGVSIMGAAIQGATSRLRPILMTSFAFISGLIPLAVASGAGALGNRSIGTAAAGGMLIGTFVGIFLIPGLYVIFESLATYLKEKKQKANEEEYEF